MNYLSKFIKRKWDSRSHLDQTMMSPFRRRYLGFRVLGRDEEVRVGDEVKFGLWCKWLPINKRNAELANQHRHLPFIYRRKL